MLETLFNCTVIDLMMKIQPFKSNKHLRADDLCTEQSRIISIFSCSNPSMFIKFKTETQVPLGEHLMFGVNCVASFCIFHL